jgi:NAD(P)-dependent dehydrogenase (short-subunit alcohol dehydrogenase family)
MRGFHSVVFFVSFVAIVCVTGTVVGVAFAFVAATAISFAYRQLTNKRLPVPANAAVLITGTSAGIGLDATLEFAKLGFTVFAGVRKHEDGESIKATAKEFAKNIVPVILDVTKKEQIDDTYTTVKQHLQQRNLKLLAVINNAGYAEIAPLELIPVNKLRKQFDVNVVGTIAVSQKFLQLLREETSPQHSTRLILISSGIGWFSLPYLGAYCATKFAIEAITDAWRVELKPFNIDVVNVAPGRTATNFHNAAKNTSSENWNEASETASVVRNFYQKGLNKMDQQQQTGGVPVSYVTRDLVRAVLDSRPYPRYFSSPEVTYGIPVVAQLPEAIVDLIFSRMVN